MRLSEWLAEGRQRLEGISETAGLDVQVLAAHVLRQPRAWVLVHDEYTVAGKEAEKLTEGLEKLAEGTPLPYVVGEWEFYGLMFSVNADVLIPRPETEILVEHALAWLRLNPEKRKAIDVGTGSGIIAVSLAVQVEDLRVTASDISEKAREVARGNAERHGVAERVTVVQGDLLPEGGGKVDLLCANLPYIPTGRLAELKVSRFEPRVALDGGEDGGDLIQRLLKQAAGGKMARGGRILLEIDYTQGSKITNSATEMFPDGDVRVIPDLNQFDRLVIVSLP